MTRTAIRRERTGPPSGKNSRARWFDGGVSTTTEDTTQMTAADRCDRCGAQAYVRVELPSGELLFCGHHARAHADAYRSVATHIQDETDRLHAEHGAG